MTRFKRVLTVVVAAIAIVGITALPASASAAGNCPSSALCLYVNAGGGAPSITYNTGGGVGCHNIPTAYNDAVSSLWNNSGHTVTFWQDANCTGFWINVTRYNGTGIENLSGTGLNDTITSWEVQ